MEHGSVTHLLINNCLDSYYSFCSPDQFKGGINGDPLDNVNSPDFCKILILNCREFKSVQGLGHKCNDTLCK